MGQVSLRHQHFILDVEANGQLPFGLFNQQQHHDADGLSYRTYAVSYKLDPSAYSPTHLIYACFFIWHGGQVKNLGEIESNTTVMMRVIDFLIEERAYGPAIFMKGMIRKYGLNVYSECFPAEAKVLLEKAKEVGVGSAAIELEHLPRYEQLAGIKSVQLGEPH